MTSKLLYEQLTYAIPLELKAVTTWHPRHEAQASHYLTATGFRLALLLNPSTVRRPVQLRCLPVGLPVVAGQASAPLPSNTNAS